MRESSKSGGPDPRLGEGGEPKHEHGEKAEHEDNSELYCIIVEIETRVSLLQNSYHAATSLRQVTRQSMLVDTELYNTMTVS